MAEQICISPTEAQRLNLLLDIINPQRCARAAEGEPPADASRQDEREEIREDFKPLPVWLDVKQACEYLHVSRSKLYLLIKEGKIPTQRVSRRILIRRQLLDDLVDSGRLA